jgi:hypothetical protein
MCRRACTGPENWPQPCTATSNLRCAYPKRPDTCCRPTTKALTAGPFCASAGLSALIRLWRTAEAVGGSLALAALTASVLRVITPTGPDTLLPVTTTGRTLAQPPSP